jgi:hypothetical protein
MRSNRTASLLRTRGIPPNRATSAGLPARSTRTSMHVRSPYGVETLALCLAAVFVTVDWCFAASVFSIDVSASHRRRVNRQTSLASR